MANFQIHFTRMTDRINGIVERIKSEPGTILRLVFRAGMCIGWIIITYQAILLLDSFGRSESGAISRRYILVPLVATGLVAIGVWLYGCSRKRPALFPYLMGFLFVGAFGIRLAWVFLIPTTPQSDFEVNHLIAASLARGEILDAYPRNIGYPLLLSFAYRIVPDPATGRLLNAALSTLTVMIVGAIGTRLGGKPVGVVAAFWMATSPPEIMMSSVLCTEVPTLTFLAAAVLLLIKNRCPIHGRLWSTLAGLSFGAAVLFRPATLVYLPLFLLGFGALKSESTKTRWTNPLLFTAALVLAHALFVGWFSLRAGHFTLLPLNNPSQYYTLLSGTDYETPIQRWNAAQADIYWSWPEAERPQKALQTAFDRILRNPQAFLRFVGEKLRVLLSDNSYGSNWSFYTLVNGWLPARIQLVQRVSETIAQAHFVTGLLIGLISLLLTRLDNRPTYFLQLAVILSIVPHLLLEAQPRYHHPLLLLLVLMAAFGSAQIFYREDGSHRSIGPLQSVDSPNL